MNFYDKLTIAIDFDGTIVEDGYPGIGKPRIFAFETLRKLQEDGHRLILWTYRSGRKLDEAVSFCNDNGIDFFAVNKSFDEEEYDDTKSRKIYADLFIDDRNIGGAMGWGEIYQLITNEIPNIKIRKKKKGFFSFFR
jgi:hydroxymethylpyrimidine pyrophosphatase-like HAD family hydrolase